MPHIDELRQSSYLKRSDVATPQLLTITGWDRKNLAPEGKEPEWKFLLTFAETEKPLVLNATNGEIIAKFTGDPHLENWVGQKIVLYDDPNIQFAGKLVGGIRVRAPKFSRPASTLPPRAVHAPLNRPDDPKPMGSVLPPALAEAMPKEEPEDVPY